jgi:hypothetical protein
MANHKSFLTYSTQAQTLQRMHNFDNPSVFDFELAQFVTYGIPDAFQAKVEDFELLEAKTFDYS